MPRRGRKCHNAHKYGSKNGRNAPDTASALAANDTVATAVPDCDVEVVEAPAECRQHRNKLDPDASSGDTDRAQQHANEKVAASPNSPRSSEGSVRDNHAPEWDPQKYMIVDMECINALIAAKVACPTCRATGRDSLSIVTAGRSRDGISSRLRMVCKNCGFLKETE